MAGKGIRRLRAVNSADPTMATVTEVVDAAASSSDADNEPVWQEMANEVNQLLNALASYGIDLRDVVHPQQLRPRIEGFSACRMLVIKGICTEEEMHAVQIEAHRDLLRGILQAAENQRLQEQRAHSLLVPEHAKQSKGLVLAKH